MRIKEQLETMIISDFREMRKKDPTITWHFLDALMGLSTTKATLEEKHELDLEDYLWAKKLLFETEIGQIGRGWQQRKRFQKQETGDTKK
jgi:hypothetical protein